MKDHELGKAAFEPCPIYPDPLRATLSDGGKVPDFVRGLLCAGACGPDLGERAPLLCPAGSHIHHDPLCARYHDGRYLIASTSVSEFIGAMERMHLTEKIVIPLSVIFRFFPTVSEEYQAIRDAMKMRGIRFGGKNPFLMVEYRLVPLIVSVVKIGDELSAAALTRGLGAPGRRTNLCRIGFHVQDLMAALFCVAASLCFCSSRRSLLGEVSEDDSD